MGEGFECFLRMCYHIFPQVTILVTTHVTICLMEFCAVSNEIHENIASLAERGEKGAVTSYLARVAIFFTYFRIVDT